MSTRIFGMILGLVWLIVAVAACMVMVVTFHFIDFDLNNNNNDKHRKVNDTFPFLIPRG
jgi:hypothetical protein